MGYRRGGVIDNPSSSSRLAIYLNAENGCAINIWAAAPGLKGHSHHIYAPGLHHLALNVALYVPLHQDMQSLWSQYDDDQISLVIDFLKKSCQAAERQVADLQSRARKKARTR